MLWLGRLQSNALLLDQNVSHAQIDTRIQLNGFIRNLINWSIIASPTVLNAGGCIQ